MSGSETCERKKYLRQLCTNPALENYRTPIFSLHKPCGNGLKYKRGVPFCCLAGLNAFYGAARID